MDKILVLDFGGQYDQLIARRVREQNVFAEIIPYDRITPAEIKKEGYCGVIFTGGPNSVYDAGSPGCDPAVLDLGIPILGICYGDQLIAHMAGGEVSSSENAAEYGRVELRVTRHVLFNAVPDKSICWMSHRDQVSTLPEGFRPVAYTENCPIAAMADDRRKIYGVQFHPEVTHTDHGKRILSNFLFLICRCSGDWKIGDIVDKSLKTLRSRLKGKKVLLALSGGVDSSVAALLLHKAVGNELTCVFVDHGLLRKDEAEYVVKTFRDELGLNLIHVNAKERLLEKLKGVRDPEQKRKIIGEEFIRVFEDVSEEVGHVDALAQGTIYPDVIESGKGDSAVIKSHHNVGGLPDVISFDEIVEPLRDLFKDEVRRMGLELGLPERLVLRQPFPGPGLAVRILGEITEEKIAILQEADAIFREVVEKSAANPGSLDEQGTPAEGEVFKKPDQYFAVLTNSRSVGVMGDKRTYGYTVALRAVTTDDFMTAGWTHLPYEVLEEAASRITNEVPGVSRVVYDISSKPPATVEWE